MDDTQKETRDPLDCACFQGFALKPSGWQVLSGAVTLPDLPFMYKMGHLRLCAQALEKHWKEEYRRKVFRKSLRIAEIIKPTIGSWQPKKVYNKHIFFYLHEKTLMYFSKLQN